MKQSQFRFKKNWLFKKILSFLLPSIDSLALSSLESLLSCIYFRVFVFKSLSVTPNKVALPIKKNAFLQNIYFCLLQDSEDEILIWTARAYLLIHKEFQQRSSSQHIAVKTSLGRMIRKSYGLKHKEVLRFMITKIGMLYWKHSKC